MNKSEILIIDDEPPIRKLLQINLESNDYKVIQASTGKEGLQISANHPPDLILLDIGLPDISGHQVLQQLREWYNNPIIILSVLDSESDIVQALDNGASDYIVKPFRTGELLARIRSSIKRNRIADNNSVIICGDIEIDLVARIARKNGHEIKLTTTEFNLLTLFIKNEGRALTHHFILKEIWGHSYQADTQYLRVFIGSLRKKIEDNPNNPQHIITLSGIGYRFK